MTNPVYGRSEENGKVSLRNKSDCLSCPRDLHDRFQDELTPGEIERMAV
jgi:hypothetical protein